MAEKGVDRQQLVTIVANWEWLRQNRAATFHPESLTIVYGDGGVDIAELARPGLTPAT
jgi:hypothetical protein